MQLGTPIEPLTHGGVQYLRFLGLLAAQLRPRRYLEVGTREGASLKQFPHAAAICVDPAFQIDSDVLLQRRETFFFQTTSDDFFARHSVQELLGGPFDVAFLDGMHLFEYLLRDFVNAEREAHRGSIIVLHDCLPTHPAMTWRRPEEREALLHAADGATPPAAYWAGDVYKIVPMLARYRPDLRIHAFDCPPTGLVVVSRLDPGSSVLGDVYYEIVDTIGRQSMDGDTLRQLWAAHPPADSRALAAAPDRVSLLYPSYGGDYRPSATRPERITGGSPSRSENVSS